MQPARAEALTLLIGLLFSVLAGVAACRVVGPYGDGPFGAGFRRISSASTGRSLLVHDLHVGTRAVRAVIDEQTGRVTELRLTADDDFTRAVRVHVDETGHLRLPRDVDTDGLADRWDYYPDLLAVDAGVPEKIGFSLAGDQVVDAWIFHDDNGRVARMELSTRRDGIVDRWEHYRGGALVRVETDTDRDGRVDAWFTYVDGILSTTASDYDHDGAPDSPAAAPR